MFQTFYFTPSNSFLILSSMDLKDKEQKKYKLKKKHPNTLF